MDPQGKIQASHLARTAYLYVRQSTMRQVAENGESTRRQYGLRERAVALGWPSARIVVIDSDLGISGASAADREGFQRLVSEVSLGRAGIVLGLEVSRLARNCSDWHRLLEICALTDTLILDEDGLYNPTLFNDRLLLGIKGTMSEAELHLLRMRLRGGLLAKAQRGELRTGLPVGFVYDEQGRVRQHPDAQVQQSIRLLFDTFRRTGSVCATVKYFRQGSLLFPRPAGHGSRTAEVLWRALTLGPAVRALHNPRYAGAFAFGRRRSHRSPAGGYRTTPVGREQWHALVLDVHPGYITWQDYEQIQQRLHRSALAYGLEHRRALPREGPALLQGLVLCGVCGSSMTVRYHDRRGTLLPDYLCCSRTVQQRESPCQVIPGAAIDAAVGRLLVESMTPMAIEIALGVQAELQARLQETDRLRQQQVQRAEQEAESARRRYLQVDPDHRLVAVTLEADWNDKLRALDEVRQQADRQRAADRATMDDSAQARIRALAEDFPAVWTDPATAARDRKRLAALLLEDVTLLKSDRLSVHVRFRAGATHTLVLPLPRNAWQKRCTHPDVVARVEQLLDDREELQIAEQLNAEGLRTGAGAPFDAAAVRWIRYCYGLKSSTARLRQAGKLTVPEMANCIGLSEWTVAQWARTGRLRASRCGRKPTWIFEPLHEQPQSVRQLLGRARKVPAPPLAPPKGWTPPEVIARVEHLLIDHDEAQIAERLAAEGMRTGAGATFTVQAVRRIRRHYRLPTPSSRLRQAGKLTSAEMAVRLGIGLSTVHTWARNGRLHGAPCGLGRRRNWLLDPLDQQPEPIRQRAAARATLPATRSRALTADAGRGAV